MVLGIIGLSIWAALFALTVLVAVSGLVFLVARSRNVKQRGTIPDSDGYFTSE